MQRRVSRLHADALEWDRKAKLAISKGRDDLARAAIAEKGLLLEALSEAENELAHLEEHLDTLNDEVGQLQKKLDEARAKQKTLILRAQTVESRYKVKRQLHASKTEDAFNKFELFEQRMDNLEGKVEAYDVGRKDLSQEINDLEKDEAVNDELARMKKEISQGE